MQFISKNTPDNFNLFLAGDMHIGCQLCHETGIDRMVESIRKPYDGISDNYLICMGDQVEAIATDDKRFDVKTIHVGRKTIDQQTDFFVEKMTPIKDRIVAILQGNHERKTENRHCIITEMANRLDTKNGTYACVVTFGNERGILFKAFLTHGNGGVSSTADAPERQLANMRIAVKRKLWRKCGDCALMAFGHTHKLIVAEPEQTLYLTSDDDRVYQNYTTVPQNAEFIPRDLRWYVNTGSFLRLYKKGVSGYAEMAMYDPVELGYAVVKVRSGLIAGIDRVIV